MLLDLEASCLALMGTDYMRETVTFEELYQCIGTVCVCVCVCVFACKKGDGKFD